MPVGFVWSLFYKINIFMTDQSTSKTKTGKEVIVYAITGLFLMLMTQFTDFYYFVKHVYISSNEKITRYQHQKISIMYMLTLLDECKRHIGQLEREEEA